MGTCSPFWDDKSGMGGVLGPPPPAATEFLSHSRPVAALGWTFLALALLYA